MKVTDIAIAFILIVLPSTLILDYKTLNTSLAVYETVKMNRVLDAAVEDGTESMFRESTSDKVTLDKENGYESFISTLYKNLGMLDDEYSRRTVEGYIPCLVAVDYDGYYIMRHVEYTKWEGTSQIREIKMAWLPKKSYSFSDDRYIYALTLGNDLTVYDKYTHKIMKNTADSIILNGSLADSDLLKAATPSVSVEKRLQEFDELRRNAIIENLQKDMMDTINNHNNIAKYYGITYYFSLPTVESTDWIKTIDDPGLMAFFQGMPMGKSGEYANIFSIGGTRIFKAFKYYLDIDGTPDASHEGGHIFYYHTTEDCPCLKPDPYSRPEAGYPSRDRAEDCAKEGYFPCEYCN